MHKNLLTAILVVLLLSTFAWAERVELGDGGNDINVVVEESSVDKTVLRFEINGFQKEQVDVNGENYYSIECDRTATLLNEGEPALPRVSRSILIPNDARMQVRVLQSEYIDIPNTPVVPSKGNLLRTVDPATVPYHLGSVYNEGLWYPKELATLREPHILRDYRGIVVELNAFQYLPTEQTLRVYTSVTVEIFQDGIDQVNVLEPRTKAHQLVPDFDMIYRRHFVNYEQVSRYTLVGESGDMLIITYDAFGTSMQPLVDWKMQKGIKTTMVNVSSIGNTASAITGFIQNFYDSTNLAFVLLVGDAAQVETPYASGGSSDPSYALVAGGDSYPDIFVGRFSAENTTHVETQVQRTITYELNPVAGDWFHQGTGIASSEGAGQGHYGEADYVHMGYIRDDLLAFTYTLIDEIYDPGATSAQVSAALNDGRSIVNYCGHGGTTSWSTTGFNNTNVNNLINDNMLPFIVSVACVNGKFDGYTCFGEAWLRAANGSTPTGAIGTYMSSIDQSWAPPMYAQDEVVDLLCAVEKTTFGGLCYNGSCYMIDEVGSGGVSMYNTWHIFGDPSVQVRTDTPAPLTVNHESVILFNFTSFDVEVVGVEGALCALYHDGVLYGSAYTASDGTVTIPIGVELPIGEQITLTVTSFNAETYTDNIQVITPDGPYIVYDGNTVSDALGNNDGVINCGETILLGIQLKNIGPDTAFNVAANLTCGDANITVTDGYESYGTIEGNDGTKYLADVFEFEVAPDAPDEYTVTFDVEITGTARDTWYGSFNLDISSPIVGFVSVSISDPTGNNNGILDPGETADLVVTINNTGTGSANGVEGTLSEDDTYTTVGDDYGYFGDLLSSSTADNGTDVFTVSIDGACPQGHQVSFLVDLGSSSGYSNTVGFSLIVGDREIFFFDNCSQDIGWAGLAGPGEWTLGMAAGGSGSDGYGGPDPSADRSETADEYVLGNDLTTGSGGDYNASLTETYWITSPLIDCEDYLGVQLQFYRWLGIGTGDYAYFQINDGTGWTTLFQNPSVMDDQQWVESSFDISEFADDNPNFQIRFGIGTTNSSAQYCGWNLDDITIRGYDQASGTGTLDLGTTELSATVFQNDTKVDTVWVHNSGDGKLKITFSGDQPWLRYNPIMQRVDPGADLAFEVTINTTGIDYGIHEGTLSFETNDGTNPSGSIPVSLTIPAPDISLGVSAIAKTSEAGAEIIVPVSLDNIGPGPLHYTVGCQMFEGKRISTAGSVTEAPVGHRIADADKGGVEEPFFSPVDRNGGGPDAHGYRWADSDEPGGPTFDWVDISTTGTELVGLQDDNFVGPISIGFSFPFYDNTYDELYVGSNGTLTFGAGSSSRSNQSFPNALVPNNLIAMWWDDLDPPEGGNVYYYNDIANGQFVITFSEVRNYESPDGTGSLSFQAILTPNGKVVLQYATMDPGEDTQGLTGASIGIEDASGTDGLQVVYNAAYMHDNMAVAFYSWGWLYVDPSGGTVDPYGTTTLNVHLNAADLVDGVYTGQLNVVSDDPDTPNIEVPVTFTVAAWICGDINGDTEGPNIADLTYLTTYLFGEGPEPPNMQAANVNALDGVNIADLTYMVAYLFAEGPDPICN